MDNDSNPGVLSAELGSLTINEIMSSALPQQDSNGRSVRFSRYVPRLKIATARHKLLFTLIHMFPVIGRIALTLRAPHFKSAGEKAEEAAEHACDIPKIVRRSEATHCIREISDGVSLLTRSSARTGRYVSFRFYNHP